MIKVVEALNNQISIKGQEINDYIEKHNIRIRNQTDAPSSAQEPEQEKKASNQGVLVDGKS